MSDPQTESAADAPKWDIDWRELLEDAKAHAELEDHILVRQVGEYTRMKARERAQAEISAERAADFREDLEALTVAGGDLMPPKDSPYLVKRLVCKRGRVMVHADPGTGKSIMALDLALHLVFGFPHWCGYRIKQPTDHLLRVLYIYSVGTGSLWKRRDAWLKKHGKTVEELGEKIMFYPKPIPLNATDAYVDELIDWARDAGYDLIIIDTWANANAGSDENAAGVMSESLNRAGRVAEELQAAVLLVHHDNRSGAFRGSSAIDGYLDTRIHLTQEGEEADRRVKFKIEKQRDDESGTSWLARLEVIDLGTDEDGDPITSVVWEHLPDETSGTKEASPEQIVWDFIRDHDGEFKKSDIPKAMGGHGVPVKRIPILVEDLIKKGYVMLEPRSVGEGNRKVTGKFVSVAPFLRDMNPENRDMWWESQTQHGHKDRREQDP
jgi:AAA domain